MENIKLTNGTVVSLDMIGSTKLFESIKDGDNEPAEYKRFQIIEKMHTAIEYILEPTDGMIVHYTGDGALIFFEDKYPATSAEQSIIFGIDFSCIWRRWKQCFTFLNSVDFRISIDYGNVIMRNDGGLWSGLVLNYASKIRHSKDEQFANRVIVTEKVMKVLPQKSLFKKIFGQDYKYNCTRSDKQLFFASPSNISNDFEHRDNPNKPLEKQKWAVCIVAIDIKQYQIIKTLESIKIQSLLPEHVVVVCDTDIGKALLSARGYPFEVHVIDKDSLGSTSRSSVRNVLVRRVMKDFKECDVICFLDGDTVLKPSIFKYAYHLLKCNNKCMISAPRIDFDHTLDEKESIYFSNLFLYDYEIRYDDSFKWKTPFYFDKKVDKKEEEEKRNVSNAVNAVSFLPSYFLIARKEIIRDIGEWDENFEGWGEEDIDYTYRAHKMGYELLKPNLPDFKTLHLSHEIGDSSSFIKNAEYLLSKYPELREERYSFYKAIGI